MALNDYEQFQNVTYIHRDYISENVLYGFIDWCRWCFLNIGGFQNITKSPAVSGVFGGNRSILRSANNPNYTDGQIWEGFRSDWVWESGVSFDTEPISISGIYIDNTFYDKDVTGTYAHYIDYPRGRVVFDNAIATTSSVSVEFSHRTVGVTDAIQPWFQQLMYDSYRVDKDDYSMSGSGAWDQMSRTRRTLPVIGMKLGKRSKNPYEIGDNTQMVQQDILCYVFADNYSDVYHLTDILDSQKDRGLWLINRGMLKDSGVYPVDLNYRGELVTNPLTYPTLVDANHYRWGKGYIVNSTVQDMDPVDNWLYRSLVKLRLEVIV